MKINPLTGKFAKIYAPIIRGTLEIALSIWLMADWCSIPKIIIYLVIASTFLQGINSILEGVRNNIDGGTSGE